MKKKLRLILLCIPLLIVAIIASVFLIRYRSAGDVLLNQVVTSSFETYLLQGREVGARQIRLSKHVGSRITFSPNGRYLAFTHWDRKGSEVLFYDTHHPRRPILRVEQSVLALQPLDDGSLLYLQADCLYRVTKQQTTLLAENICDLGAVSGDGASIYCFRPAEDGTTLCRLRLANCSIESLLEHADETALQVVQDEAGQDIVICAQSFTYEFPAYDLVLDTLEEADAASTDEEAQKRNALRTQLKEKIITTTGRTVWRIVGSEQQLLAEGVQKPYYCDPLTGTLVYRHCQRFAAPVEIQTLREAYIPERMQWHFSLLGTEFTPPDLKGAFAAEPQFSGDGSLAILKDSVLYLWQMEDGVLGEAKVMTDPAQDFALLRSSDGGNCLYYKTSSGLLRRYDGTQDFILSANVLSAHLPCRVLPDGTKQQIDDMVYIIQYAETSLHRDNLPPATMSQMINLRPRDTTLYLVAPNGEKTVVANISNNLLKTLAALTDGSMLAESGPFYIVGENRTDRLRLRYHSYSIRSSWPETELVTLQ